jgi:hypothetical protein
VFGAALALALRSRATPNGDRRRALLLNERSLSPFTYGGEAMICSFIALASTKGQRRQNPAKHALIMLLAGSPCVQDKC